MFCPRCGSNQSEDLKFCKVCGANLSAVRQAVDTRDTGEKTDRSKPWYAEMTLSDAESKRRQAELDHHRGVGPEVKRYNEIKGGVITTSVGLALTIFLHVFMKGLIVSGSVSPETAEILSRVWVAGVIPLFIGTALIVNGVFVSKRQAEVSKRAAQTGFSLSEKDTHPLELQSAESTEFIPSGFSVTEGTTKHLRNHGQNQ